MVVVDAASHVQQGRAAERPGPRGGRADALVGARPGETVVRRTAIQAEGTGVVHHRPHEADAVRHLILGAGADVELHVEAIGRLLARLRLLIVVLSEGRTVDVGRRNEPDEALSDRAEPVRRNDVAGKDHPVVPVHVPCERIVDALRDGAEVAAAHGQRRHDGAHDVARVVDGPLIIAEEEELVVNDRSAEGEAGVEELRRGFQVCEVLARVGRIRVAEHERASFDLVGARLQGDVRHRPARPPELRVVVARRHAHRLERIGGGNDHLQQSGLVIVVEPLDQRVVRQTRLAVDFHGQRILRVEEGRVFTVRTRRARHCDQDALEIPVEGERHVAHHLRFDDTARIGAVGLQDRALTDDCN